MLSLARYLSTSTGSSDRGPLKGKDAANLKPGYQVLEIQERPGIIQIKNEINPDLEPFTTSKVFPLHRCALCLLTGQNFHPSVCIFNLSLSR